VEEGGIQGFIDGRAVETIARRFSFCRRLLFPFASFLMIIVSL
jgi:hypothetical protein